mmetsp:Transcript_26798/g.4814  ORF Transcript_26798/g.4814 Transcript_26798/m.4814 type:complete len:108 (-) Transcript_26798:1351-1674(-)
MLMTGSEKTSLIASRILRRVIPTQHSPQTIGFIWDKLDTGKITLGLSEQSRTGLIHTLFGIIGIRKTWLYRGSVLKKLERWEIEAHDFLRALANEERWKDDILRVIL